MRTWRVGQVPGCEVGVVCAGLLEKAPMLQISESVSKQDRSRCGVGSINDSFGC
jgi:hypothetical protein